MPVDNVGDFGAFYSDSPWANLDRNQRTWYDPVLRDFFRRRNAYSQFATFVQNVGAQNAKTMVLSGLLDAHPNFDPLGLRQMWMPAMHVDSMEISITFNRYGGKVAYDKYSSMVNHWKQAQRAGLSRILNDQLGHHMVAVMDRLVRNAYLNLDFKMFIGGASNFGSVADTHLFDPQMVDDIHLGMKYREVPGALSATGATDTQRTIVAITTPGVIYDIQQGGNDVNPPADSRWVYTNAYASPTRLINYEVGTYRNVRFIETPDAVLWNCGDIYEQKIMTVPHNAGDGAGKQVDGAWTPGQIQARGYLQLDSATNINKNEIITIHTRRTNEFGVSGGYNGGGGVDYRDGRLHNRRVIDVDTTNHRIYLDKPIMVDYNEDLDGGGSYGYVTKGRHIHTTLFLGGPDGIVVGNGRPVELHAPPAIDDFESMFRFSWDGYLGHQAYNPHVAEVVFSAGSFRFKGARSVQ